LTTVTIPRNVTFIGSRAFEDCNLSSVTSLNPIPPSISIGQLNSPGINGTFDGSWNAYLFVPQENIIDYSLATGWSLFRNITGIDIGVAVVTFFAQGGSSVSVQVLEPGSKVIKPYDPSRTNYIFSGWYKDATTTLPWDFDNDIVNTNTNLYAKWTPGWYCGPTYQTRTDVTAVLIDGTLTIGGTGAMSEYTLSNSPPWNDFRDSINTIIIETGVTSIGDYAFIGSINLSTITALSPTPPTIAPNTFSATHKDAIAVFVPENSISAYRQAEVWQDFASINGIDANAIVVTFNSASGSAVEPQVVRSGSRVSRPPDPTRNNYIFVGWYRDALGNIAWDFGTDIVSMPITLYAVWTPVWDCGETPETVVASLSGGTLVIRGTGAMKNFSLGDPQWYNSRSQITSIVIENGVTTIGNFAFYGCGALVSVSVPNSVTSIGAQAFSSSGKLSEIAVLAPNPPTVSPSAFDEGHKRDASLLVPYSNAPAYRRADVWRDFENLKVVWWQPSVFTVGPNPLAKRSASAVNFYYDGGVIENASLSIYNASGSVVLKNLPIYDNFNSNANAESRRQVGAWDLRDSGGRLVPAGTYLVRGVVRVAGGRSERVSLVVGVR
jgi:uncharacterized repeat protein (TIGR02543 family)